MVQTVVVGLGRSGIGAAELLITQRVPTAVIESGDSPALRERAERLERQGIEVNLNTPLTRESFAQWPSLKSVVISPGISWTHPTLVALRKDGIEVKGEMAVAWEALNHIPWVGITGTNGKTTVTHLLSHVLNASGCAAPMAGNVGISAAEIARQLQQQHQSLPEWLVMELSSYQIEAAPMIRPRIGIWTTLTPDHLERHGTLEAYRSIKRGLLERSDLAIYNADDPDLRRHRRDLGPGLWVSAEGPDPDGQSVDLWIDDQNRIQSPQGSICDADALAMPGAHNRQNLLLVCAAAQAIGLSPAAIEAGLRSFPGVPHRLEAIGHLGSIAIVNDSKATNYDAAAVGLKAMKAPVVVLAGGQTKQGDASDWLEQLRRQACAVVLFGSGADELAALITAGGFDGLVSRHEDMTDAVPAAIRVARERNAASILLSPACASWDQYSDFEARGDHFKALIQSEQATA